MDRIDALEKRWLNYKLREWFRYALAALVVLAVCGGAAFWIAGGKTARQTAQTEPAVTPATPAQAATTPATPAAAQTAQTTPAAPTDQQPPPPQATTRVDQPQAVSNTNTNIQPRTVVPLELSVSFSQNNGNANVQPPAQPPRAFTQPPASSLHLAPAEPFGNLGSSTPAQTEYVQPQQQLPSLPPAIENPPAERGTGTATIRRITSLEELEAAYAKQPTLSKAVEIAETYLNRNDFQNAYNWAIKANEIDGQEERSWEVFAKASYKMGRKDRAINALRAYLDTRYSERLNRLLAQMEADAQ